jgi:hypothetical protein
MELAQQWVKLNQTTQFDTTRDIYKRYSVDLVGIITNVLGPKQGK